MISVGMLSLAGLSLCGSVGYSSPSVLLQLPVWLRVGSLLSVAEDATAIQGK